MRIFRGLFVLLFFPVLLSAQEHKHDSLTRDTLLVHFTTLSPDFFLTEDSVEFTADLKSFTGLNPLNALTWTASNGSMGAPYQLLWFPEHVDELHPDFFAFFHRPDEYLFFRENIPIFLDTLPFSVASYSNGYKREQYFDFLHSQPLTDSWRLTLNYRLINSPGAYKNQKNSLSNFFAVTSFTTKSKVYHLNAGFILNRIYQQENGGVKYNYEFIDTTVYDRALTEINLLSAQNRFRQNDYFVTNEIRFGGKKDGDHRLFLQHTFNLRRERHIYSDSFDPDSSYYTAWTAAATADSVNHYAFENTLMVGNRHSKLLRWHAGVFISDDHLYNAGSDTVLSQKILKSGLSVNLIKGHLLVANASVEFESEGISDHDLHIEFVSNDSLKWRPYLRFSYCLISPQIYYFKYHGNHISWNHNWNQTKTLMGVGGLDFGGLSISGYFAQFSDYMYFNGTSFAQGGEGSAAGLKLAADVEFGRFRLTGIAGVQDVGHANYINLPPWFAKAEIAMRNSVFKKALTLQTGLSAWINGAYFADAYNPALQIFYMQRDIKTGGFVYPTVFVRAQIKRAVVFAELANFTAGFTKVNYWQIPGYPLQDRAFRFGVTWSFLN
ncbi:MAG: hypothetical protein A2W93_13600 [Bacteroidetes bacterium GWF2_43_63]|nr:MAG: hypothetical protein A2W94_03795 [Bacteroidetes bacterium GWE2_42_42]OFY55024.1 MAG: hypothetical protein A2W93_13600 [Bacteroidetes bacterium GWF2_43_63]HBG69560.1 hypothetical protein [Bacteroidales bacterium]HCB60701.1 hypothetical protein [Bacteroidales bacterium]HCY23995.1 hypothetical protein [Bacteroidales bacterium]